MITISKMGMYNGVFLFVCLFLFLFLCLLPPKFYLLLKSWRYFELLEENAKLMLSICIQVSTKIVVDDKNLRKF